MRNLVIFILIVALAAFFVGLIIEPKDEFYNDFNFKPSKDDTVFQRLNGEL